jgi:hypothetical protein
MSTVALRLRADAVQKFAQDLEALSLPSETRADRLLVETIQRGARTAHGIAVLVESGLPQPAYILSRPLFEDVVLAYWIALKC